MIMNFVLTTLTCVLINDRIYGHLDVFGFHVDRVFVYAKAAHNLVYLRIHCFSSATRINNRRDALYHLFHVISVYCVLSS